MLTLKVLFHQGLCQVHGLTCSLVRLMGLDWTEPCFSTLSRRQATLAVKIPVRRSAEPLHRLADGTSIKIHGEGEWEVKKHGPECRRGWRKELLAIDAQTQEVCAVEVTDQRQADGPQVEELLSQLPPETVLASVGDDDVGAEPQRQAGGDQEAGVGHREALERLPPQQAGGGGNASLQATWRKATGSPPRTAGRRGARALCDLVIAVCSWVCHQTVARA